MEYIVPVEILLLHSTIVDELGGTHGVHDIKIVQRACAYIRNDTMFPTIFDKASALLFALAKKKPFIDLNLPTALAATELFLEQNTHTLDLTDSSVHDFIGNDLPHARVGDIVLWMEKCARSSAL